MTGLIRLATAGAGGYIAQRFASQYTQSTPVRVGVALMVAFAVYKVYPVIVEGSPLSGALEVDGDDAEGYYRGALREAAAHCAECEYE